MQQLDSKEKVRIQAGLRAIVDVIEKIRIRISLLKEGIFFALALSALKRRRAAQRKTISAFEQRM